MTSSVEDVVRAYYSAFNTRDLEAYARLFTADCVTEAPGFSQRGVDGVRAFDRVWFEAFPKSRIESMRMTSVGDVVVTGNWFHGGKHEGTLRSPAGDLPATGAIFEAPYLARFHVQGGRITLQRLLLEMDFVPLKLGVRGA
jgi:hypothetical protein